MRLLVFIVGELLRLAPIFLFAFIVAFGFIAYCVYR